MGDDSVEDDEVDETRYLHRYGIKAEKDGQM